MFLKIFTRVYLFQKYIYTGLKLKKRKVKLYSTSNMLRSKQKRFFFLIMGSPQFQVKKISKCCGIIQLFKSFRSRKQKRQLLIKKKKERETRDEFRN